MKSKIYILIFLVLALGCKKEAEPELDTEGGKTSKKETIKADYVHNSRKALDYIGTYDGIIPCADCEGIKTSITINTDGTFSRSIQYLGKEDSPSTDTGYYTWNKEGSIITIKTSANKTQEYKVGEGVLFHLDREGNMIQGDLADNYRLQKKTQILTDIENKNWILIELQGKKIENTGNSSEAYIMFDSNLSQVSGNNSCNNFSGNYNLRGNGRISLGELGITQRFCNDEEIRKRETAFNTMLNKMDNYALKNGTLSFSKARMAPLAKFKLE